VSAAAVSALPQRIAALTDLWNDDIAAAGHGQTMAKRGAGAMLSGIERHESMGLSAKAWRELTTPASSTPNANMIASPPETGNLLKTGFLQKLLVTCSQLGDDVAKSIGEDTYGKKKAAMFGALVTHPWMLDLLGLVLEGELLLATLPKGGSKITSLRIAQLEIEGTILNLRLGDWLATEVSSKGFPSCSGQKEKGLCGEGVLALKDGAVSYGWGQIDADRALLELAACANRISTQIVHGSDPTQVRANPAALTTKGMTFYMGNIGASVSELRLEKIKARARAQATSSNEPKPVQILTAKDLIVGYRPDVQLHMANLGSEAGGNRKWYSLTARRLGKLGFKHLHPTVSLDDIEETEGMITWVSKLAQEKGGKIEEYPLEEIFTWDNWSVVDPQPSATHSQDTLPSIGAFMNIRYLPTDLPPQRVGWAYRIGMRVVYADGRSLSVNDAAKLYEDKQEHAVIGEDGDYDGPVESVERFKPFLRYEPIQPPGSHFFDLPGQETHPSETSYLMVVRTTHLNSRRFTSAPSVRVLTPPRTSLDLAIRMGQFDDPRSREVLPKGAFRGVVLKEDGSFPAFRSHPSLGKGQAIDTVYRESLFAQSPKNPYLPDPWARRLMIAIYRRTDSAPVHIAYHEYYDERHVWPNCRPLRLLVTGHTGPASEIPSVGFRVEQTADSLSITLRAGEEFLLQAWHEITFEQLERSGAIDSLAHYVMQDPKGYSALGWVNRPESIADARRKIAAMLADFDKRVSFDFWSLLGKIGGSSGQTSNRAPQPKQMNFTSFWMINPSVDLTLVHSIDRPNWEPALVEKTPPASEDRRYAVAFGLNRQPGSTKVVLNGSVRLRSQIDRENRRADRIRGMDRWRPRNGCAGHVGDPPRRRARPAGQARAHARLERGGL
jgi:hypothetical protein